MGRSPDRPRDDPPDGRRAGRRVRGLAVPVSLAPGRFAGAPLDALKGLAAVLMIGDHVDTILLDGHAVALWRLGRVSFPLFCLVTALHLARGADPGRYALALLVLAVPTQAVYAAAFPYGTTEGSILFTLAAGTAAAAWLVRASEIAVHAAFAAGLALVFLAPGLAKTGVDFGLAGVLMVPALRLALARPARFAPWLLLTVYGLNRHGWHPRGEEPVLAAGLDAATICAGLALAAWAALRLEGRPRFLPPYALQAFYPAHLLVLTALRAAGLTLG